MEQNKNNVVNTENLPLTPKAFKNFPKSFVVRSLPFVIVLGGISIYSYSKSLISYHFKHPIDHGLPSIPPSDSTFIFTSEFQKTFAEKAGKVL